MANNNVTRTTELEEIQYVGEFGKTKHVHVDGMMVQVQYMCSSL